MIFGAHEVERLIERRFTASELDDLKNGRISPPVARQGTSETIDESFQEKNGLDAYIAFDKYPTIIRRADGNWVELNCPICHGNCIEDEYLVGVPSFRQHLEHDHGHTVPFDEIPAEWVVRQCESRQLTEHELMGLLEDRGDAEPPGRINVGAGSVEEDKEEEHAHAEESFKDDIGVAQSTKRHAASPAEEEDLDDYILKQNKRARESTASSLSTRPTKDPFKNQQNTPAHQDRVFKEGSANKSIRADDGVSAWSDCCPCTLEGHECQNHDCSKAKVCMQLDHSKDCLPGATHAFIPLCMMFLLGQSCNADTCDFSHDEQCKKVLENHCCDKH